MLCDVPTPWLLVGVTCAASALGSLMIYVDSVWNRISRRQFSILRSNYFLGVALSLSTGTLLVTAINALLPKSLAYILDGQPGLNPKRANSVVVALFVTGAIGCHVFNYLVLKFTSRSVIACPHDIDNVTRRPSKIFALSNEHTPLLSRCQNAADEENCVGTGDFEAQFGPTVSVSCDDLDSDDSDTPGYSQIHSHGNSHHHAGHSNAHNHFNTHSHDSHASIDHSGRTSQDYVNLLSIGLQTTMGIAVHRVPEGLLLFATSQTDSQLGTSLVLALSIHSFSEGFSIAAPLYTALQNRLKVIAIAVLLGCGPQVLGALIGSYMFPVAERISHESMVNFGLTMAATAGFMFVLSLQMVSSAFTYLSQRLAINSVLLGSVLSLASRSI